MSKNHRKTSGETEQIHGKKVLSCRKKVSETARKNSLDVKNSGMRGKVIE